jgi:hypothetical protein
LTSILEEKRFRDAVTRDVEVSRTKATEQDADLLDAHTGDAVDREGRPEASETHAPPYFAMLAVGAEGLVVVGKRREEQEAREVLHQSLTIAASMGEIDHLRASLSTLIPAQLPGDPSPPVRELPRRGSEACFGALTARSERAVTPLGGELLVCGGSECVARLSRQLGDTDAPTRPKRPPTVAGRAQLTTGPRWCQP